MTLGQGIERRRLPAAGTHARHACWVTVLRGERVLLRPLTEADLDPIAAMLAEPDVARWWGVYDADRVRREHLEDPDSESFAIEVDGAVAGIMQVSEENDPGYRHAGLDISLATAFHNRGLGRDALLLMIDHLARDRGHHRFTIDPDVANEPAIRCYAAVGFRPVGVMRQYSRSVDGSLHDGLLMDLLADQLPD
jgi:aminoglycoside 6'-N-acetyltransferase